MHFLLGVKPGDHAFLFEQLIAAYDADRVTTLSWKSPHGRQCEITFVHQLPLNESNPDLLLNFRNTLDMTRTESRRSLLLGHHSDDHP